jgi:hypothetical protein
MTNGEPEPFFSLNPADDEPPEVRVSNNRGWVYQNHWMAMHRIPPVPIKWILDFVDYWSGRHR